MVRMTAAGYAGKGSPDRVEVLTDKGKLAVLDTHEEHILLFIDAPGVRFDFFEWSGGSGLSLKPFDQPFRGRAGRRVGAVNNIERIIAAKAVG